MKGLAKLVFLYVKTNLTSPFSFQLTQTLKVCYDLKKNFFWIKCFQLQKSVYKVIQVCGMDIYNYFF